MILKKAGTMDVDEIVGEKCTNLEDVVVPECHGYCDNVKVANQTCLPKRLNAQVPFKSYKFICEGKRMYKRFIHVCNLYVYIFADPMK